MTVKDLIEYIKNYPEADVRTDGGDIKHIFCDEYPETGEILLVTLSNE